MNLVIENLNVYYDEQVIKSLNLKVEEGEFCTLIGHSGTGKSTVLKSIAGLIEMSADKILLGDLDIRNMPSYKREIGYVFQKPLLFPHLNVYQNISYSLEIRSWPREAIEKRVKELLTLLELSGYEKRMPHELSGGQQQRIAIGRALAFNPKILLMDEPFSSLDPILRRQMGSFLKTLQKKLSLTILFVTHDPNEALKLSDKLVFIYEGALQQWGTPGELFDTPRTKAIGDFFGQANWLEKEGASLLDIMIKDDELVLIRPHHLELNLEGRWMVVEKHQVGKTTEYIIETAQLRLKVEVLLDTLKIGDAVSPKVVHHHIIGA